MYAFNYSVRMFDTDASGFLFFTSQMRMAHEAYEAFMASQGLSIGHILRGSDYLLPIVHAETDYKAPSHVGDTLSVEVSAEKVGTTSFTLSYRFVTEAGLVAGLAQTVHVAIDKATHQKLPLPAPLRAALESL
jgi:1,4-dihydroxy-2-naphthoyl-CoA hydrolase